MTSVPCVIAANPDIAGVGVRVSVYIQAALVLIPAILKMVEDLAADDDNDGEADEKSSPEPASTEKLSSGLSKYHRTAVQWDDIAELMNPNLALGYALIISGIIQARTFGLTVYHAITVLNLNWIISFSLIPCFILSKNDDRKGDQTGYARKASYYLGQMVLSAAFGLWLFSNINNFDHTADSCTSSTLFYIPGKSANVTSPIFRRFWIAMYSIMVIPFVNFFFLFFLFLLFLGIGFLAQIVPAVVTYIATSCFPKLNNRLEKALPLVVCSVGALLPQMFFIVLTERMIAINDVAGGESQWTFGQTAALLVALSSVRSVVRQVLKTVSNVKRLQSGEASPASDNGEAEENRHGGDPEA